MNESGGHQDEVSLTVYKCEILRRFLVDACKPNAATLAKTCHLPTLCITQLKQLAKVAKGTRNHESVTKHCVEINKRSYDPPIDSRDGFYDYRRIAW